MATRLSPEDRRQQLLDAAGHILSTRGLDAVRIPDVAQAAGVTRPVVYKFFPNRRALVMDLLEDFVAALEDRFLRCLVVSPMGMEPLARALAGACCDVIEEKGKGAWILLDTSDGDPEMASVVRAFHERLVAPWIQRITQITGADMTNVIAAVAMMAGASRAAIGLWIEGVLAREQAVEALIAGVNALIGAFTTTGKPIEEVWANWVNG